MFFSVRKFVNEIAAKIRAFGERFGTKKEDHRASQVVSADHDRVLAEPNIKTSNRLAYNLRCHLAGEVLDQFQIADSLTKSRIQSVIGGDIRMARARHIVFAGPSRQLKIDLSKALALTLGMRFVYVSCKDYPPDDPNDTSWKTPVTKNVTKIDNEGRQYLEAVLAYPKRHNMLDWLRGPTPGFVGCDEDWDLKNQLLRDPNLFVFMDRLEETDFSFLRSVRNTFEWGYLEGVPLRGSIFVLSTEAFADTITSDESVKDYCIRQIMSRHSMTAEEKNKEAETVRQKTDLTYERDSIFHHLWNGRMEGESEVVQISQVVVL